MTHPTARAGAILWAARLRGKLKGDTMDTGPIGKRRTMLWNPFVRCDRSIGANSPAQQINKLLLYPCTHDARELPLMVADNIVAHVSK